MSKKQKRPSKKRQNELKILPPLILPDTETENVKHFGFLKWWANEQQLTFYDKVFLTKKMYEMALNVINHELSDFGILLEQDKQDKGHWEINTVCKLVLSDYIDIDSINGESSVVFGIISLSSGMFFWSQNIAILNNTLDKIEQDLKRMENFSSWSEMNKAGEIIPPLVHEEID